MTPDLVLLGNLLVDDVVFLDGRTRMCEPGGAVLYGALAAALCGVRVGLASVRGTDYPAWAFEALRERGIDTTGVSELGRPGLRTWLLYEGRRRHVVHRLDGPTHAELSPGAVPWPDARAYHLAPMPAEVQRSLLRSIHGRPALVSLDPYLLLTPETFDSWKELASLVDTLFLSDDEWGLSTAEPLGVLRSLAGRRLRHIVWKRGEQGGWLYDARKDSVLPWAARPGPVVDPTGAGDAFAAGLLAGWLQGRPDASALQQGVVAASLAIEDWGAAGLLSATPALLQARLREVQI